MTYLDRRSFILRSAALAGGVVLTPQLLAACGGDDGGSTSALVIGTPENPAKLPTVGEPIADGLAAEGGSLQVLNYADYISPDVVAAFEALTGATVVISTYDTEEGALAKLRSGAFKPDLILGMTDAVLARLVAAELLQPLNRTYLSNFGNVLTGLQDPYYDLGAQYTVPYNIYTTGIGYRTDEDVDTSYFDGNNGWDILWDSAYNGRVGVLDSYRDTISAALYRAGGRDVNTGDAAALDQALKDLQEMAAAVSPKIDITSYTEIPEGNRTVGHCWSGDMLLATLSYLPEGVGPEVIGYWTSDPTISANDFMCVTKAAERPVLAHQMIDYLLDPDNALENFGWNGYQPAIGALTTELLVETEYVPEHLTTALVSTAQYETGLRYVSLEPDIDKLWNDAWSTFTAG